MRIQLLAFTDNGRVLAERLSDFFNGMEGFFAEQAKDSKALKENFADFDAHIFIGASGIAVRLISPFIKDKLTDPAVIVIDERGNFVIPLLSGHVGGANELSAKIAEFLNGIPVITTATDVNGVVAFDELAAKNSLSIIGRDNIKKVSSGLLRGKPVNVALSDDIVITSDEADIDKEVLGLLYRPIVVGLGMRKDKDFESLEKFFLDTLRELKVEVDSVCGIASIDVKKDELALRLLSEKYNIKLFFYSAAELEAVNGDFDESEFVKATVGVSDVSARAAAALGRRGSFILKKKKQDGMTISVFEKYRRVTFEY